jgi:hypothetical protein
MMDDRVANVRVKPRRMGVILAALALVAGVWVLSAQCHAGEPSGPTPVHELRTLLAAASDNILSESDMAGQTGTGLRPPSIISNETSSARVTLWDEIKTSPMLNPAPDGVVTGGVGGR